MAPAPKKLNKRLTPAIPPTAQSAPITGIVIRAIVVLRWYFHQVPRQCWDGLSRGASRRRFEPAWRSLSRKRRDSCDRYELFRTCANEHVAGRRLGLYRRKAAEARAPCAAQSGPACRPALLSRACRRNMIGRQGQARRKSLEMGMFRHEMPILAGLRHVVETALEGAWDDPSRQDMARRTPGILPE